MPPLSCYCTAFTVSRLLLTFIIYKAGQEYKWQLWWPPFGLDAPSETCSHQPLWPSHPAICRIFLKRITANDNISIISLHFHFLSYVVLPLSLWFGILPVNALTAFASLRSPQFNNAFRHTWLVMSFTQLSYWFPLMSCNMSSWHIMVPWMRP